MIRIYNTYEDFFKKDKFVLTNKVFIGDIVEIEFVDKTIKFIVIDKTEIAFANNVSDAVTLINFMHYNFYINHVFDTEIYEYDEGFKCKKETYAGQYFVKFNEIELIKETEIKIFKRLGNENNAQN